jgi:catechol 2,3-dioxygenase-like lactoylglutathione lyase family enzyme
MQACASTTPLAARRTGVTAVHSVNRVVFTVPDIDVAYKFYTAFGMNVQRKDQQADIYTHGHPHCWMSVIANGQAKALQYLSFGIYAEDETAFAKTIAAKGIACEPHPLAPQGGLWLRSPDGTAIQLVVAAKVSPDSKTPPSPLTPPARGTAAAPMRTKVSQVQPRWLSHVLVFTADVSGMIDFCAEVLGLRLSDRSVDIVAFMHTPHGSDHHLLAFVGSAGPGLHHTSWDVGRLDDVGEGSEQLRKAGYTEGWGVGRHVLGSNYFYYARDPWGSFAEYSFDIDYIPSTMRWEAGNYAPEDSFYLWGPAVPDWFTANTETANPR